MRFILDAAVLRELGCSSDSARGWRATSGWFGRPKCPRSGHAPGKHRNTTGDDCGAARGNGSDTANSADYAWIDLA